MKQSSEQAYCSIPRVVLRILHFIRFHYNTTRVKAAEHGQ